MRRGKGAHRNASVILTLLAWLAALAAPAAQASEAGLLCDAAAAQAAEQTDVPLSVLRAITRTETGRRVDGEVQPWPWAVNAAGEGRWFDSRQDALAWAMSKQQAGARNFDVGCFQINYRWHGENFASVDAMFEPLANALYAARFLSRLHDELGDWTLAAGAFHSRNETYASRYRSRFSEIRAALTPPNPRLPGLAAAPAPRQNTFPLLVGRSADGAMGSLVPLGGS
ncbi:lytic transglycosylase domain-containing protein [Pseudoroseicyclus sp. H15]